MSLKVTVLGCGTAYGVPVVGGDWVDCNPDNPKNRRLCPAILLKKNKTKVLIDLGPDYRIQAEKHQIRKLDGVVYTHPHADHIVGNFHLPMMMRYYKKGEMLPLYAERSTRKEIEKVWWFQNDPAINVDYYGEGKPLWQEIAPFIPFNIGDITLEPHRQWHGKMPTLGFRIGDFAYCTDVSEMPEESFANLNQLDTLILECNQEDDSDSSHIYLEKALRWIEKLAPKTTYLTHLNHTVDYDTMSQKLPNNVHLAYDDLEIEMTD